jgi:hypothetical protein
MKTDKIILLTHVAYKAAKEDAPLRLDWIEDITEPATTSQHCYVDRALGPRPGSSGYQYDSKDIFSHMVGQRTAVHHLFKGKDNKAGVGWVRPDESWKNLAPFNGIGPDPDEWPSKTYDWKALRRIVRRKRKNKNKKAFLDLPPEIRNRIYGEVLFSAPHRSLRGILAASKKVHAEASSLLYSKATFAFDEITCGHRWLSEMTRLSASFLTRLRMQLLPRDEDESRVQRELFSQLVGQAHSLEYTTFYLHVDRKDVGQDIFVTDPTIDVSADTRMYFNGASKYAETMDGISNLLCKLPGIKELRIKREFVQFPESGWEKYLRGEGMKLPQRSDHEEGPYMHLSLYTAHQGDLAKAQDAMIQKQQEWADCLFVWFDWVKKDRGVDSRAKWELWRG